MSTLNVSNITDGTTTVGTSYVVNGSAKAWLDLVGTGTISIDGSFNISSVTDNGTGYYRQTYSNAFSNNDLSFLVSSNAFHARAFDSETTYAEIKTYDSSASASDYSRVHTATFGDLA